MVLYKYCLMHSRSTQRKRVLAPELAEERMECNYGNVYNMQMPAGMTSDIPARYALTLKRARVLIFGCVKLSTCVLLTLCVYVFVF